MKNAILLHGHGDDPKSYWFPWLAEQLRERSYDVWVPHLPDADHPTIAVQLPHILENGTFTEETVLVGHSSGCPLILAALDSVSVKVRQAVLVAGFASPLEQDPESVLQIHPYNWENIIAHVEDITFINSDNDPWGCDDKKGREMFDHAGGTLIVRHGEGHMGSQRFGQPYKEFPLLLKLIDLK